MLRAMINCNDVQTEVITEGRWVEERPPLDSGNKHIVLTIPGNPGIPEFYKDFAKAVKSKLPPETPVWVVGHAGHVQPSKNLEIAMPSNSTWDQHYGLTAQLEHKKEFIKKYVPEDAKLHIIGHSIGSWFALNLLSDESIAKRVVKCYMLFPTIEHMAKSRNGVFFTNVVQRIAPLLVFLSWIFCMFPLFLQVFLIRAFGVFYGIPGKHVKSVRTLLNPHALRRVIELGKEEMIRVKEPNDDLLSQHQDKLWFYYGATDGWTPVRYYKNMKTKYPNMDAQLCQRGFYHSFVLKHDKQMGDIVGSLINESICNLSNN